MIWESLIALGVEIASKVIVYTVFLQQCSTIIHTGKCIVKALHDLLMRYHYGKQAVLSSHLLKDSMISEGFNVLYYNITAVTRLHNRKSLFAVVYPMKPVV